MSGSTPRRIEPLTKHTQLRALDGLARSNSHLLFGRSWLLQLECCQGSATQAGRISAWQRPRMRLSHLRSVGKVVGRYRGTQGASLPNGIDSAGVEDHPWGGAAIVLRGRESLLPGKGRQG